MTYGTPSSLAEVGAYYTHIMGGRRPSDAAIENLTARYRAIGGTSPLLRITESVGVKLQEKIRRGGSDTRVYTAMKHSSPFIAEVVTKAAADGVDKLLAIPLAPQFSKMSSGTYLMAAEMANSSLQNRMQLDAILSWHNHPQLVEAWVKRVRKAEESLPRDASVIFSAHSLPESTLAQGDPYRSQALETSHLVAEELGRQGWTFAFQSASHSSEPWLGPDILDHLQALLEKGRGSFLVVPVGFVADHLEILYDIDIECRGWAKDHGVLLERCESLNDADDFVSCLQSLVREKDFQ